MKKRTITLLTAFAAAIALAPAAQAQTIIPLTGASSTAGDEDFWEVTRVTDGLRMSGEGASGMYTGSGYGGWFGSDATTWFRVDLGQSYDVGTMYVWNGQPGDGVSDRGVGSADIYYSTDENAVGGDWGNWGWTQIGTTETFTKKPGVVGDGGAELADYGPTDAFDLDVTARVIGLEVNQGFGGNGGNSLAQLQFFTAGSTDPEITSITSLDDGTWELTLEGEASTGYEFRSSPTLEFTPGALVDSLTQNEPTNDPGTVTDANLLTTDSNGDGKVQMALSGNPADFVRAQIPPPVTVFEDNFDGADKDWTSGVDAAGVPATAWEPGNPTGGATNGPTAANSPNNCYGTNIAADYGLDTDIWLRTPSIDLTAHTEGSLQFKQFRDIETGFLDLGSIRILAADDLAELAVLEPKVEGTSTDWEDYSKALPEEAFDEAIIIEFRFESDEEENQAGWYIDDVAVIVP